MRESVDQGGMCEGLTTLRSGGFLLEPGSKGVEHGEDEGEEREHGPIKEFRTTWIREFRSTS